MLKVGILSMQRIFNYGSFLQAYALKKILEELGCNVQFVDYHIEKCLVDSNKKKGIYRKILKVIEVFKYKAPFKEKIKFIQYKKNYASNYYPYLGVNNNMNYTPYLDMLIIGSDEVFNCVQNNTNVGYSLELFGKGHNAKRVVSYAASFGNTTLDKLDKYNIKKEIAGYLKKFDSISVRDENTGNIIKCLTEKNFEYNLDPVLIYDYINKCNDIPQTIEESNYIVLYGYSGRFTDEECNFIKNYIKEKNLKIYCIGGVQNCCDKFIDCSPFKVIAYFQHAEFVITDTFHGTIMSIITHKRFVSLVRKNGYGNFEKLTDLLNRINLTSRIIENITFLDEILNNPINYDDVDNIIQKERLHTYDYLKKQIDVLNGGNHE